MYHISMPLTTTPNQSNVVDVVTLIAALIVLLIEVHAWWKVYTISVVWRCIDDSMRCGYELQDRDDLTAQMVWNWVSRTELFAGHALGYHAWRTVMHEHQTFEALQREINGYGMHRVIQDVLNGIFHGLSDKIAVGRISPDFNPLTWHGWNPMMPMRVNLDRRPPLLKSI